MKHAEDSHKQKAVVKRIARRAARQIDAMGLLLRGAQMQAAPPRWRTANDPNGPIDQEIHGGQLVDDHPRRVSRPAPEAKAGTNAECGLIASSLPGWHQIANVPVTSEARPPPPISLERPDRQ